MTGLGGGVTHEDDAEDENEVVQVHNGRPHRLVHDLFCEGLGFRHLCWLREGVGVSC